MINFVGEYNVRFEMNTEVNEEQDVTVERLEKDACDIPELIKNILEEVLSGTVTVEGKTFKVKEV